MKRFFLAVLFALPTAVLATDVPMYTLTIKNHRYEPTTLKVPADTQIKITVVNKDSTPEEFESTDFRREKIVMPNGSITVFVGPLKAGQYKFFGDFHQDTAQGVLIAE
ncbi:MAG: cupredoxin domain-containing protein [Rhodanobacter sp.]